MKKLKRNIFVILFISVNILFIFLQIHKQSTFIKLSYENQRLEKEKQQLVHKKEELTQKLYELQDPSEIKKFASNDLNMQKIKLNQIKKIDINNEHITM